MAKRSEYLTIDGYDFKVTHKAMQSYYGHGYNYRLLSDCYARPSIAKQRIFEHWCNFFYEHFNAYGGMYCGIISYNCMMFTFGAQALIDYNGETVDAEFYITKTRQEVTIYDL